MLKLIKQHARPEELRIAEYHSYTFRLLSYIWNCADYRGENYSPKSLRPLYTLS
jgi:hypothetical protein